MAHEYNKKSTTENQEDSQKYQLGMQILLEGAKAPTGQSPNESIWIKYKA
jgi:hypothetical protein